MNMVLVAYRSDLLILIQMMLNVSQSSADVCLWHCRILHLPDPTGLSGCVSPGVPHVTIRLLHSTHMLLCLIVFWVVLNIGNTLFLF